jgi:organic hydroperoxide reductase OsmC/OhrA
MAREYRFPVHIGWDGERRTRASVAGKEPLPIATPPEFRGTDPTLWSPEDAFVAAAASCLAVTIVALAEREEVPLHGLKVRAEGVVGRRTDGRFGFTGIEQEVDVTTDPGHEEVARTLVAKAEQTCLVTASLNIPVDSTVRIGAASTAPGEHSGQGRTRHGLR